MKASILTRAAVVLAVALGPRHLPGQEAGAGSSATAESIEQLVRRSIDAYGGEAALRTASVFVQRGTVTSSMQDGRSGALVRIYERPVRLRVEIVYPGAEPETRVLDGGQGWRNGVRTSGPMYQAMLLQSARLGLPVLFLDFEGRLEDHGEVERDGGRRRTIGLGFHGGLQVIAEIDPSSGRILRTEGSIAGEGGRPALSFATDYGDFREVDGVLVPFRETSYAQGMRTGETQLESVDILDAAPSGTFHPPIPAEPGTETRRTRT